MEEDEQVVWRIKQASGGSVLLGTKAATEYSERYAKMYGVGLMGRSLSMRLIPCFEKGQQAIMR